MSKTVKGEVQATSDKEDKDFFGICIDDEWYNGEGSLEQDLKGMTLELTVDPEAEWNGIQKIDVIEEDNEDGQKGREASDAGTGSGSSNAGNKSSSNMSPRQAGITANSAVKIAAEHTNKDYDENPKDYIEEVDEMSKAFNNMIKDRLGENL